MNKFDSLIKLIADSNVKTLLAIFVVSVSSLWLLLFYFFSWEEFSFFYAYQNPDYAATIFNAHGFSYHRIFPYLGILFKLFGYNPLPYNILSLFIFFLLGVQVFLFTKIAGDTDTKTASLAGLLFASGYYGIGTFITDTYSAYDGGFGTSLILISLILYTLLIKKFNWHYFGFFTLAFLLAVYFFPTRTYPLPGLIFILTFFKTKKFFLSLFLGGLFTITLLISLRSQVGIYSSLIAHVDFKIGDFTKSLLENISNLFIPSMFFRGSSLIKVFAGFLLMVVLIIKKQTRMFFLMVLISVSGHLLVQVIAFQYFATWESWNHFHTSYYIFVASTLAILFRPRVIILVTLIIFNITNSNIQVYDGLINHSNILRYFYEAIQTQVPNTPEKKAIVVFTKEPRPLSPFIHLPEVSPEVYLPGFYYKRAEDMKVVQSFEEAQQYLKENNLTPDNLYVFHYSVNNLDNVSEQARRILKTESEIIPDNPKQTTVSGVIPFSISFELAEKDQPDFLSQEEQLISHYLKWADNIKVETSPNSSYEDRKLEYLTDHDYETSWIPGEWEKPVAINFQFPQAKEINYFTWAVSRIANWTQRTPTTYKIFVKENNGNWVLVKGVNNGSALKNGEVRKEVINFNNPVVGVKFEIWKTLEGALPAFDEIEFITEDIPGMEYEKISSLVVSSQKKICLQWRILEDDAFRFQRQYCQKSGKGNKVFNARIEARTKDVRGFRVVDNEDQEMEMKNVKITYPKI